MSNYATATGLEKASVLLLSLGVDNSSKVLQYLGESEIERVLMSLSKASSIPPEIRSVALQEAYELAQAGTGLHGGGVEYSRQLLARAVGPRRGAEILERISAHQTLSSFEMLRSADPAQVASLLEDEMPQTIALVLSYLEAKVAADILTSMPKDLQIEVVLRLAGMDRVSPQVVQVVEKDLKEFSKARAEEIASEGAGGSSRLLEIVEDPPRYLNTALFLRMLTEIAAIVLVTVVMLDLIVPRGGSESGPQADGGRWWAMLASLAIMLVVSFVVIGVAPRTVGRQHSERIALLSAGPLIAFTKVLGPVPRLLILVGNAITPGRGFSEGPFASEAELRELVDLAEASSVIESGERQMIHSVFELGDTLVREVMVPRTDVVFIERGKTLRQAMSLALRSGYSRIPVVGENLDDIVGFAYLKDLTKRVFDRHEAETTERVESVMRPVLYVPDSKPIDALLREMQAERKHVGVVVDEYGGTAGLVTIEDVLEEIVGEITDEYDVARVDVEHLTHGGVRVSSRYPVDDLEDIVGVVVDDDDVDSIGGLMAKHLGRVPIAGSVVELQGLRFEAEAPAGRRNRIGTVLVSRIEVPADADGSRADPYPEPHAG